MYALKSKILEFRNRIEFLEAQLLPRIQSSEATQTDSNLELLTDSVLALNLRTQKAEFYGPSSSQYFFDRLCAISQPPPYKPIADDDSQKGADLGGSSAANEGRVINEPIMVSENEVKSPSTEAESQHEEANHGNPFPLPREEADKLVSAYWVEVAPLLPIFDEKEFWWAYKNLWSVKSSWERRNPLELQWDIVLVLMVFALATQHAAMRNVSGDIGEECFNRAREGLGDIFGSANFGSVRCLLLMVLTPSHITDQGCMAA